MNNSTPKHGYMAAVGTFDGVHLGHAFVVEQLKHLAAARGLKTKIITFEKHPLSVVAPDRCPATLTPTNRRTELMTDLGVDQVVVLPFDRTMAAMTAAEFLAMLHNSENVVALAMGFNNHIGSDRRAAASLAPATSGVEIVPLEELDNRSGVSSSAIRNALIHGKVEEAAALLGRPFEITGTVVHGKQLGRRIGFPTANINLIQPDLIVPADGAYAVDVRLADGTTHRAMANIGHRPTVDTPDSPLSIEIHIIDFSGNLYGTAINVSFLKRLRPEQRFNSIESLKAQLEIDRQHAILA